MSFINSSKFAFLIVLMAVYFAWLHRFSIVPAAGSLTCAYKLDRWTGEVIFLADSRQFFLSNPKTRD
jgi:hypothetical protein